MLADLRILASQGMCAKQSETEKDKSVLTVDFLTKAVTTKRDVTILKADVRLELETVEFNKSRFATYFGNIGEMIAEQVLLKQGFSVWGLKPFHAGRLRTERGIFGNLFNCLSFLYPSNDRIFDGTLGYEKSRELAIKELENFFGEKLDAFRKYMESIGVIGKTGMVGAAQIKAEIKSKHVYTPDLVVNKDNEIWIVEVKTNSGNIYLKPEKVEGLLSARKFGLIPLLINLNVSIDATNFMMQELPATTNLNNKP